jgi:hypothetical protein
MDCLPEFESSPAQPKRLVATLQVAWFPAPQKKGRVREATRI